MPGRRRSDRYPSRTVRSPLQPAKFQGEVRASWLGRHRAYSRANGSPGHEPPGTGRMWFATAMERLTRNRAEWAKRPLPEILMEKGKPFGRWPSTWRERGLAAERRRCAAGARALLTVGQGTWSSEESGKNVADGS